MNTIVEKFPPEIYMKIIKFLVHPVADILKQHWEQKRKEEEDEEEQLDLRIWQEHYRLNYNSIYQYI